MFVAAMAIAAWAFAIDRLTLRFGMDCLLGWTLLALAWIDWQHMRLPDPLTLPLLLLGLAAAWLDASTTVASSVIGAVAGYAALWSIEHGYRLVRGHEGLGRGDAKLFAAGGAWLGWQALPWTLLLASIAGIGLVLLQRARGAKLTRETALPFGPALAAAIWLVRLYGVPDPG
ncbi:MAG: A24 family peptidase [Acetobacteraceae bacterium]